jgi:hypothetical protein
VSDPTDDAMKAAADEALATHSLADHIEEKHKERADLEAWNAELMALPLSERAAFRKLRYP